MTFRLPDEFKSEFVSPTVMQIIDKKTREVVLIVNISMLAQPLANGKRLLKEDSTPVGVALLHLLALIKSKQETYLQQQQVFGKQRWFLMRETPQGRDTQLISAAAANVLIKDGYDVR